MYPTFYQQKKDENKQKQTLKVLLTYQFLQFLLIVHFNLKPICCHFHWENGKHEYALNKVGKKENFTQSRDHQISCVAGVSNQ